MAAFFFLLGALCTSFEASRSLFFSLRGSLPSLSSPTPLPSPGSGGPSPLTPLASPPWLRVPPVLSTPCATAPAPSATLPYHRPLPFPAPAPMNPRLRAPPPTSSLLSLLPPLVGLHHRLPLRSPSGVCLPSFTYFFFFHVFDPPHPLRTDLHTAPTFSLLTTTSSWSPPLPSPSISLKCVPSFLHLSFFFFYFLFYFSTHPTHIEEREGGTWGRERAGKGRSTTEWECREEERGFERVRVGVRLGSRRGCGGRGREGCGGRLCGVGEVREAPGVGEGRRGGLVAPELGEGRQGELVAPEPGEGRGGGLVVAQIWV